MEKTIDRIRYYEVSGQKIGIGYFNERLVEFMVSKDGNTQYEEITLIQSLDWFEKMYYSNLRLPMVSASYDGGALRWFRDLASALRDKTAIAALNVSTPLLIGSAAAALPIHPTNEAAKTQTLAVTITELVLAKTEGNRRPRYVDGLEKMLRQFSRSRESTPLNEITTADIEAWLRRTKNPYTRQTYLSRLTTLFSFALRRGYVCLNPCVRIERVTIDLKPPLVLKPEQAKALFDLYPAKLKPYLIFGMYAGIRPEEIMRLDWSSVNLETKTVKVDGKTRRRRIVPLEPITVKLLAPYVQPNGLVAPHLSTIRRWSRKARTLLELKIWPTDLLRHTAASYLLALHKDAGKVANMLGNSPQILLSHYHDPVTEADCKAFWGI